MTMLTLNFQVRMVGSSAYNAPAIMPITKERTATSTGGPGIYSAQTVAVNVPAIICPSTPMLMYPARQAIAVAIAQRVIGVARVKVENR
ncbi:hypothetical protein SDC9_177990 [bioreactor metagenome]|uniref:Uncharacterized protein n=1 Tax=bioreactor metagenome TaxID=1076179 RepID=A0A645GXN6_9ZZZZ